MKSVTMAFVTLVKLGHYKIVVTVYICSALIRQNYCMVDNYSSRIDLSTVCHMKETNVLISCVITSTIAIFALVIASFFYKHCNKKYFHFSWCCKFWRGGWRGGWIKRGWNECSLKETTGKGYSLYPFNKKCQNFSKLLHRCTTPVEYSSGCTTVVKYIINFAYQFFVTGPAAWNGL